MARSTGRKVKRATTKAPIADNKKCNCSPSAVSYFIWSNSTCPIGAELIYSGVVAGSHSGHSGAAVNPLYAYLLTHSTFHIKITIKILYKCMEQNIKQTTRVQSTMQMIAMYRVLCALFITIPSHYDCLLGWRREYYGLISVYT